ncbi:hypothetical protein EDC96DRAFT_547215 [Choanephora cucurbitarum]|nr:hypothetical protein EDC96DRAFT_547215 [Choanephora cucurbitarum]
MAFAFTSLRCEIGNNNLGDMPFQIHGQMYPMQDPFFCLKKDKIQDMLSCISLVLSFQLHLEQATIASCCSQYKCCPWVKIERLETAKVQNICSSGSRLKKDKTVYELDECYGPSNWVLMLTWQVSLVANLNEKKKRT